MDFTVSVLLGSFLLLVVAQFIFIWATKIVTNIWLLGVNVEIKVGGNVYNGAMPPWRSLSDDELAAVMIYTHSGWGNQGAPITPATVKAQREASKDQTVPHKRGAALKASI
jgi:hypothetical protein